MISIVAGLILGISVIFWAKNSDKPKLIYTFNVASFPLYYIAFAVLFDQSFIATELLWGIPFFLSLLLLFFNVPRAAFFMLGILYIAHVFYDVYHHDLVAGSHIPHWYPNLCAAVDFVIGIYLVFIASFAFPDTKTEQQREIKN